MESVKELTVGGNLPSGNNLMLIDFSATWCGPCKSYSPIFAKVAAANPDVTFVKVDIDQHPQLAAQYGVQAVPTTVAVRGGAVVANRPGAMAEPTLSALVDNHRVQGNCCLNRWLLSKARLQWLL